MNMLILDTHNRSLAIQVRTFAQCQRSFFEEPNLFPIMISTIFLTMRFNLSILSYLFESYVAVAVSMCSLF